MDVKKKSHIRDGNQTSSVAEVIRMTRAMTNSNCRVNNPKGTCCYPDIEAVFEKYRKNLG